MRDGQRVDKPPKPIETKRSCEKCLWWEEELTSDVARQGRCHFYPPRDSKGFPKTWHCDWCEKFLRKRFDNRDNA